MTRLPILSPEISTYRDLVFNHGGYTPRPQCWWVGGQTHWNRTMRFLSLEHLNIGNP